MMIPQGGYHDLAYNLSQTYILQANRLCLPICPELQDTNEFATILKDVDPLLLSVSMGTSEGQHFLLGILHTQLLMQRLAEETEEGEDDETYS
jgi:hypothetical protein